MQPTDLATEILLLEDQLLYHTKLLDKAFSENRQFAETRVIFHEVKRITDRLAQIKHKARTINLPFLSP
jgi:hypothetical protein